jgi:hypothetical protein
MPEPRDTTAFEVREALAAPGCAVCTLAIRSVRRLIRSIAYEQVNDLELRARLRRTRGFCNPHAHLWLAHARSVLGSALIYRDVLRASLDDLDSAAKGRGRIFQGLFNGASERSSSELACPLCAAQADAEARYLEALLATLAADPGTLADSDGLCRVHTLAAVRLGGPALPAIVARARAQIEAIVADLDEVIRKEDYRFRHEARTEAERSAAARAVAWAAGADGLGRP